MSCEKVLHFRDADLDVGGSLSVNLMFPATEGTAKGVLTPTNSCPTPEGGGVNEGN